MRIWTKLASVVFILSCVPVVGCGGTDGTAGVVNDLDASTDDGASGADTAVDSATSDTGATSDATSDSGNDAGRERPRERPNRRHRR